MKRHFAVVSLLVLALAGPALATTRTWLGSDTNWNNTANWSGGAVPGNGDNVIIPDLATDPSLPPGTNPATGSFTFFEVQAGAVVTCLGDTGVVNEASGGTVTVPHGIGATINVSGNATIAGTLYGFEKGFPTNAGPGAIGGAGGGSYGGKGKGSSASTYGSLTQPTALGSGGGGASNPKPGGGAIKLNVTGTLTVNGTINMNGGSHRNCGTGGSIWLIADTLAGNGIIMAEGGATTDGTGAGGGGRIALEYNTKTFNGTLSAAGGANTWGTTAAQPGTLWEPKRYVGQEGSAGSPVNVTITNGFQYQFTNGSPTYYWNLTVDRDGVELHDGSLVVNNLIITNSVATRTNANLRFDSNLGGGTNFDMQSLSVTGSIALYRAFLYLSVEGAYNLAGNLYVGTNAIIYALGNTTNANAASGGTTGNPHGIGGTLNVGGDAAIDGTIYGTELGFPINAGPGAIGGTGGGTYGGKGQSSSASTYGSLTQPTALGSGGGSGSNPKPGGGAIKLNVTGTLTVNGTIVMNGGSHRSSGSGGSIWLSADTFAGSGIIKAEGGPTTDGTGAGGGGRITLAYNTKTFAGTLSVNGGTNSGKTGTFFQCQSPYPGTYSTGYLGVALASVFSISSNNVKIARVVSRWGRGAACWTELSTDNGGAQLDNTATYSFSGLTPDERYRIFDNDAPKDVLTTDGSGGLSFAVALTNGAHAIRVEGPAGTIVKFR